MTEQVARKDKKIEKADLKVSVADTEEENLFEDWNIVKKNSVYFGNQSQDLSLPRRALYL